MKNEKNMNTHNNELFERARKKQSNSNVHLDFCVRFTLLLVFALKRKILFYYPLNAAQHSPSGGRKPKLFKWLQTFKSFISSKAEQSCKMVDNPE